MNIAFQTGTLVTAGYGPKDYLKVASDLKFKYIEFWIDRANLWPYSTTREERKQMIDLISNYDLKVVSTCPVFFTAEKWQKFEFEFNLAHPEEGQRKKAVKFVKDAIDLTSELGGKLMLTLPGKVEQPSLMESKVSYRKYFEQSVKSLKECARYAENAGIILGVENAVVGNFADLPEELYRLVREVGSEHVKAYLDVANANVYHSPIEYIRVLKDVLADLIHITDNDGSYPNHLPIGMGNIDFKGVLKELKSLGWDGYLVPELFYDKDPIGGIKQSKEKLLGLIQSI